jgi:hypothetical protein
LFDEDEMTTHELLVLYPQLSLTTIKNIVNRRSWKHLK